MPKMPDVTRSYQEEGEANVFPGQNHQVTPKHRRLKLSLTLGGVSWGGVRERESEEKGGVYVYV